MGDAPTTVTKDRRRLELENHPHWCHISLHCPTGCALPFWAVDTKHSLSVGRLDPGVDLRSGDSLLGARETTSSAENRGRCKHIGEIKNSHTPATTPKHGVNGERATRPVEEHDQTNALRPLLQRITGVVLHAWFDRLPRGRHLHPLSWDHASGPEARAGVLLALGALEKVLGFADVLVRDGVDHGAGPDLVERFVADRPAPDTACIKRDVAEACHPSLRPASARSRRQQRSIRGVVLTLLEKTQLPLNSGNVATFLQTRPIPVGGRTGPVHRHEVSRQDLNQFSNIRSGNQPASKKGHT